MGVILAQVAQPVRAATRASLGCGGDNALAQQNARARACARADSVQMAKHRPSTLQAGLAPRIRWRRLRLSKASSIGSIQWRGRSMDLTCRDLYAECLFRITSVHWQTIHRNEGSFGEQVIPNVTGCGLFPLRRSYVAIVSSMARTVRSASLRKR